MQHDKAESTVFVVDDEVEVRDSIAHLLKSMGMAVETFASGEDFLAHYRNGGPGCLVLDICMPGMDGLSLQKQLRAACVPIPVIIITAHADVNVAIRAMKIGATDFFEKPYDSDLLVKSIRCALQRDADTRSRTLGREEGLKRLRRLTTRERQVCDLIIAGWRSKEIAHKLGIAEKTVEAHRSSVMRETECSSVAELVRLVMTAKT